MIPSVKTIMQVTGGDKAKAKAIRTVMEEGAQWGVPSRMERIDSILGTHGVEYITRGHNAKSPPITYCNIGDPYRTTVLQVKESFRIGCWGDIVERGNYD